MKRLVIFGRGASGKSTLAARLGELTHLPMIELDRIFWQPGLAATPRDHPAEPLQEARMNVSIAANVILPSQASAGDVVPERSGDSRPAQRPSGQFGGFAATSLPSPGDLHL